MRNFKKVLLESLAFFVIITGISAITIYYFFNTETQYYQDVDYRNSLKGTIDCVIIGSSDGLAGFVPSIINNKLNCSCYNLCGASLSLNGRIELLKEEIDRNPIETIIVNVCDDDLIYDIETHNAEGDTLLLPRIDGNNKRFKYFSENVLIKDYPYVYAQYMQNGFKAIVNYNKKSAVDYEALGWHKKEANNIFLSDEEIKHSFLMCNRIVEKKGNRSRLLELIELCQSRNIRVVLVNLPISESRIWQNKNYDDLKKIFENVAKRKNCIFMDLNLIKNREQIINDRESFADQMHLSIQGAKASTELFCDVLKKNDAGENISDMFYDSYDEAIKHFEYYEIYQKLIQEQK